MLDSQSLTFLSAYFLRKDEAFESGSMLSATLMQLPVVKSTARTRRQTGVLTLSRNQNHQSEPVDRRLLKRQLTPRKKMTLKDDDPLTLNWLEEGWIIKEIRLKRDGRTVDHSDYRMGPRLFAFLEKQASDQARQRSEQLSRIRTAFDSTAIPAALPSIRLKLIEKIREDVLNENTTDVMHLNDRFVKTWPAEKRIRYLRFLLALVRISAVQDQFDWKQIGAAYFKKIGGSKQFDRDKPDFLQQFTDRFGFSAELLGLTSLGSITPVYFSGAVRGKQSVYDYGTVHAVTSVSLTTDCYKTQARTLWLVENRAILTRMAAEDHFLKRRAVLLVGCDGHVRSAHCHFIEQLLKGSHLHQVLIWTDYDRDGLLIANELFQIIRTTDSEIPVKWIGPDQKALPDPDDYQQKMAAFLAEKNREQEEKMGDAALWTQWITD
ncbi:DUF2399 domain-containing protein [Sporolactobacillus vineae]|uniref:DUF2399 domain-containing protein n=1 Tax=Sporolactobacillus vineae TaxID=444463 RepID=UPI000289C9B8|nr:DUF2399 domain-containing protein [Sporolactobacillus vineae]